MAEDFRRSGFYFFIIHEFIPQEARPVILYHDDLWSEIDTQIITVKPALAVERIAGTVRAPEIIVIRVVIVFQRLKREIVAQILGQ